MFPHALDDARRPAPDLAKFAVTANAFLPEASPPTRLADAYYEPWEHLAHRLPALIRDGRIRHAVAQLPVLSTARLRSEAEWRRAYALLAFVTHAHVWGGDRPAEVLPPQVTLPFLRAADHLELPPVLTYAGANLWNFSCAGHDFSDPERLSTLFSFTGTQSEAWFLLISVAIEARAAGVLQTMLAALDAVRARDLAAVAAALDALRRCILGVAAMLDRMSERCDPLVFYHRIRPFLAGSMNMAAAGLPRGVLYDEGAGRGQWRQLRGGSNGQSSLVHFFDVVLGVDHGAAGFHADVRDYMPGPHRRFLVHVARAGSIRELALATPSPHPLRDAYAAATDALRLFRDRHIQLVARYIVLPSKQPLCAAPRLNLASACAAEGDDELTGTGGTQLVPFLKKARDETREAALLEPHPARSS